MYCLNPNLDGYKKVHVARSQATNRKQGGLLLRAPLLLVDWESYITSSQPKDTKIPPYTGGSSYFLIEKSPKTAFF
jgi:hypothetical protein